MSADGGTTFVRSHAPKVVAAPTIRQDIGQGRPRGFVNPSNILSHGGYRYFLAYTFGYGEQKAGACLFRSSIQATAADWLAYDGQGFNILMSDPYRTAEPSSHTCQPVGSFPGAVGSIVKHKESGTFIAISQLGPTEKHVGGRIAYALSDDLIHWTAFETLVANDSMWSKSCTIRFGYASLLDPTSSDRNFSDVGDAGYVYMTAFNLKDCTIKADRDLVRLPVHITRSR